MSSRESDLYEYLFLQNFSQKPVRLEEKTPSCLEEGTLMLGEVSEKGEIEGYGTAIVRKNSVK